MWSPLGRVALCQGIPKAKLLPGFLTEYAPLRDGGGGDGAHITYGPREAFEWDESWEETRNEDKSRNFLRLVCEHIKNGVSLHKLKDIVSLQGGELVGLPRPVSHF